MISSEMIMKEDSIEKLFCIPFSNLEVSNLNKNSSLFLARLLVIEKSNFSEMDLQQNEKPFLYLIFEKRLQLHTYSLSIYAKFLFAEICTSAGEIIMYCWYLQYISNRDKIKKFTLENICDIWANGFPTNDSLKNIWNLQKVHRKDFGKSDNLLDYYSAGKSILN